ncbi:MAG: hypothetical protein ABJF23_08120 [Bryobacteraceae bacterium]
MTRRFFQGLMLSPVLSAAYRIKQTTGRPQIVDDAGKVVENPALIAVPLLERHEYADVFDPEVEEQIRRKCSSAAKSSAEFVAYTFTAIPPWTRAWTDWFRALPTDSPGKQQYVLFLKETYKYSIGDVNKTYGIDSTSFTDLGQFNWKEAKLDAERPRADDEEFLGWIAQSLFGPAAEALRKADSKHLILGQQFGPDTPKAVLQASAKALGL